MRKACMLLVSSSLICLMVQSIALPTVEARSATIASVQNIRHWRTGVSIRVVIDLDSEVRHENIRLASPDRICLDLSDATLNSRFSYRSLIVGDELLRKIRVAQNQLDVVRVVLDLSSKTDYRVSELRNPFRIVIDLQVQSPSKVGLNAMPYASKPRPDEIGPLDRSKLPSVIDRVLPRAVTPEPVPDISSNPKPQDRLDAVALVQNVRYRALNDRTEILIDLDSDAQYATARLGGPERVYFDISKSRLSSEFQNRAAPVGDKFLKQIRVAQNRPDVVRVVMNISENAEYRVSQLQNPFCIVIDLYGSPGEGRGVDPLPSASDGNSDKTEPAVASPALAVDRSASKIPRALIAANVEPGSASSRGTEVDPEQPLAFLAEPVDPPPEEPVERPPSPLPPAKTVEETGESSAEQAVLPLTISGTLFSGYYSSYARGGGNAEHTIHFVPAGATVDVAGYYLTPNVLDYSIQTELNAGPQASDAGFIGGNGVRINVTSFRKGAFPLTFRYSNVQLKDAYFGNLGQVSSYTLNNRNKDIGLSAGVNLAGLPNVTVDWGGDSVQSQAYNPAIPDYTSRSNHLNLNCSDQRWGWDFQCFAGYQRQTSDLFAPQSDETNSSLLRQTVTQYRASARRSLFADSDLYVEAGSQDTANIIADRPIDLATRYVNANLRMFQRRKWKGSLRAGYTSNIAGLLLTQLVSGLGGNGSVVPDASVLQPFHRTTSYFNLNGLTSVDLSRGFGLYGSVDRTAVITAGDRERDSRYFMTTGGMTYSRAFGWGNLSGQYGNSYGNGSVTGQTGRIIGQNYAVTTQLGKADGFLFDFSVRGTGQSVHNEIPVREGAFASDAGVGFRVLGQFRARFGGGWQRSTFTNGGNEFDNKGYTARIGLEHPRFQLSGSLNSNIGNSLQAYSQIFSGIGVESTFLSPFHIVPSDFRGVTLTLHLIPIRKLEFSALFTHSIQHLEGIVANDFQVIDVYATYHFRKLELVAGYFSSSQIYSSVIAIYPETQRGRFYVRLSRPVKFL